VTLTGENRITERKTSSSVTFSITSLALTRKRTQDPVVRGRRLKNSSFYLTENTIRLNYKHKLVKFVHRRKRCL